MEVLNKFHYSNSHLQMRQNPILNAKYSGQILINFLMLPTLVIETSKPSRHYCSYNSEEKVEQNEPFLRGDATYCFGLHWHSVQLESLKQHENMAFLFLICSMPRFYCKIGCRISKANNQIHLKL